MPLLDEVADFLGQQPSLGLITGVNLFKSDLPDTQVPAFAVGLIEYQGRPPTRVHDQPGIAWEEARLHVIVRGASPNDYPAARALAQEIQQALTQLEGTVRGVRYLAVDALQAPFDVGPDPLNRPLVACNYSVRKEPS